jgi:hypothetical protein
MATVPSLVEVWAMERDVDLRGFGGTTFRREARQRGLEPDECYKLIEVIVSNPLVDKRAVYAGLSGERGGRRLVSGVPQKTKNPLISQEVLWRGGRDSNPRPPA